MPSHDILNRNENDARHLEACTFLARNTILTVIKRIMCMNLLLKYTPAQVPLRATTEGAPATSNS